MCKYNTKKISMFNLKINNNEKNNYNNWKSVHIYCRLPFI
jgi:hypothetical protein